MRRYVETFFLHPVLFLLPLLVILAGAGFLAYRGARDATPYRAEATVVVDLDPSRSRPTGERPPAEQYAELLGELIGTDSFVQASLQRTSLAASIADGGNTTRMINDVRAGWQHRVTGANTMAVSYACRDADLCGDTVAAVLAAFRDEVSATAVANRKAAVTFYEQQLRTAEQQLRNIQPSDPSWNGVRENYESILPKLTDARLEEALEQQRRQAEFRILSAPQVWDTPSSPVRAAVIPAIVGLVLGTILVAGMVVLATWLDTTVRSPEDALERLKLNTVAVVPRRSARRATIR